MVSILVLLLTPCAAQFGGFFDHVFQNQGQRQERPAGGASKVVNNMVENTYNDLECNRFLCEDTLVCVDGPNDCPCPFPDSQLRCELPNNQGYVCISKPSNKDGPTCEYIQDIMRE
ncbi:Lcl2 protein [Starmerella bacillaris]|uniref:Long chronological lifespan protein 2 n=1 Tax=Starmerella bacillaris TaxID=1247836 RepID=A0AAV5RJS6_STABA|nr:Lcl2 protein [Starmerella bacillaris]